MPVIIPWPDIFKGTLQYQEDLGPGILGQRLAGI
jgi:hypothetical protein